MKKIIESKWFHILIIIAGSIFILLGAFHTEVWFDESYTIALISHDFSEIVQIDAKDVHPVLYYFLLKIVTSIFGNSILIARLFSVLAGILIGILGLGGAIIIDAVTFYICGVLIMAIKLKDKLVVNEKLTVKSYFIDLKEGFSYVKKDGLLLNIVIFAAVVNALLVPCNSMQAPYVKVF